MSTAVYDETAVIARAKVGEAAAFGALVERHQEVAFRTAYLVLRDVAGAEDVAQDAFVRAYRSMRTFRDGEPFRPWLLRIVTRLALNEARARSRRDRLSGALRALGARSAPSPERDVQAADETAEVMAAMNELSLDDRAVLCLRYFVELPEREMAIALGCRPGTVKSRLHRASKRLRTLIEQKYPHLREPSDG